MIKQLLNLVLFLALLSAPIYTQSAMSETESAVNLQKAARSNSILKNALRWKWGKDQKGWKLYVPLIQRTLNTAAKPESKEFAEEVSEWQKKSGLAANGILDLDTLMSFIDFWQSRRIAEFYEADEAQLLSAPIAEFFDPTRSASLLKVDKEAHAAYIKMLEAARLEGVPGLPSKFLKIISAYRSPAYQAELRQREPGLNQAQLALKSMHFTGRALDIYVGGDPVSTKDFNRSVQIKTAAYLWLVENADRFGFFPYFYEPWHWEYVGVKTEN